MLLTISPNTNQEHKKSIHWRFAWIIIRKIKWKRIKTEVKWKNLLSGFEINKKFESKYTQPFKKQNHIYIYIYICIYIYIFEKSS